VKFQHTVFYDILSTSNIKKIVNNKITCYCCQEQITKISNLSIHIHNTIIIFEIYVLQLIFRERDISTILYTSYQMHSVFLQTTREIFASKHHHLSLHITIFFILDVANIFLITVIYEDINIDIISYTIVFSCNPQEKYLHKNTVIYLS